MRAYILMIVLGSIVGLSLLSGCRTNPRTQRETALLRAEILDLEDQYYAMKSRYESAVRQLRECRGEPVDAPIDGLTGSEMLNGPLGECIDCEPGMAINDSGSSYLESDYGQSPDNPVAQPDAMDTFREANPPGSIQPNLDPPGNLERLPPAEGENPQSGYQDSFELDWDDEAIDLESNVSSVHIHSRYTYASNIDGREGDDGLVLMVQPKDANSRTVFAPGALIVEIIDPSLERNQRRIGRWEFTRDELRLFASDRSERGYVLHLPWDRNVPRSNRLRVLVRFITTDGRRLDSSSEFNLTPPPSDYSPKDPLIADWMMRAGSPSDQTQQVRRGVNAIPASSGPKIQRPRWRPVR